MSAFPVSSFLQIAHGELSSASVGNFGKYRDLVIAIALFLILDLGVLVLNFFASTLIETDAARINIASELRMLSQQMTKSLLTMIGQAQRHFGDDLEISVLKTFSGNATRLVSESRSRPVLLPMTRNGYEAVLAIHMNQASDTAA